MSLVPQLGIGELLLLAILALVIVGPKDLPRLMHGVGKAVGQMRRLADEFKAGFAQMAREAEIENLRAEIDQLKKTNPASEVGNAFKDAGRELGDTLDDRAETPARKPAADAAESVPAKDDGGESRKEP